MDNVLVRYVTGPSIPGIDLDRIEGSRDIMGARISGKDCSTIARHATIIITCM